MPVVSRLVSILLRIGEIGFGAVVAGLIGAQLDHYHHGDSIPLARFIYAEVVAGISILFGLLWLIPFSGGFVTWGIDIVLSLAWFAVFGLLVDFTKGRCGTRAFDWNNLTGSDLCAKFRASQAFSFLSAVFWLVSAIVGIWFVHRERRKAVADTRRPRRGFFRRHRV